MVVSTLHRLHLSTTFQVLQTYSAKGPWDKSLNFIFPTKYSVIPKSLKVSHWLSKQMKTPGPALADIPFFKLHGSQAVPMDQMFHGNPGLG